MLVHFKKAFFLVWGGFLVLLILSCSSVFAQSASQRSTQHSLQQTETDMTATPSPTSQSSAAGVLATSTPESADSGSTTMPDPNNPNEGGTVIGQVFMDSNQNGAYDPDEPFLANMVVILRDTETNGLKLTITLSTDSFGAFRFMNIPSADYIVSVDLPLEYGLLEGYEVARLTVASADVAQAALGVVRTTNDLYMPVIVQ